MESAFFAFLSIQNRSRVIRFFLLFVVITLVGAACSSESKTWTSKAFHNTTAHYNGYYYAREEIRSIENQLLKSRRDDYNRILRLFPSADSTMAKSYEKEIEETIRMASLAIQHHPNSKWVDDCYILVGKARLYSLDWGNAIQTFKFVNTKSKDNNARHLAIINLARTFTEHKEYDNAEAAFDFLAKEKLSRTNKKLFALEKAHYYQMREDYDKMVRNLTEATPYLKKRDKPGRIFFIIGQVYQKLGFEAEAYNYYRKCLSTHPEYEVDFYARLYMAQVAEISKSRSIVAARKSFKKLLKDSKNRDFRDKIYYEMGVFERKQGNINEAITNLNLALRTGNNKQVDGEAYLKLGEIYYDTLRNFELSQAYYDSAVSSLPPDYENYESIKERQEILDEFVKNLKTIEWQDSLLVLVKMDTAQLRKHITTVIESQKKEEPVSKKKKKRNRININAVNTALTPANFENTDWYFGNPSAIAIGKTEFVRVWGNIPLDDNWRRSGRGGVQTRQQNAPINENVTESTQETTVATVKKDPVQEELNRIIPQLPTTPEKKQAALTKIEDAYFRLGDIYYFKLHENQNAIESYQTLLSRFPKTDYYPEVLYKLYLLHRDSNPDIAAKFASQLTTQFPNSTFARVLLNPNYYQESNQLVAEQKKRYKQAYDLFQTGSLRQADSLARAARDLDQYSTFAPNLELLIILIAGKTEDITRYQFMLETFINNHPEHELKSYVEKLLVSSREFQTKQEKSRGVQYVRSFEEPHYFVLVYQREEKMENIAIDILDKFNRENFRDLQLKSSNLILNDIYSITLVSDLPRISSALEYYMKFTEKQRDLTGLQNHKFDTFVITKDNFDIFYRTKGLDEYIRFFKQNYRTENP